MDVEGEPERELQVLIFDDPEEVARAAAEEFLRRAVARGEAGQTFNLALSGGSTPQWLFQVLAEAPYRNQVPWRLVHVFWGDERIVPPDHPESNYGAARAALLERVALPAANVHRIRAELRDPADAAAEYEAELRRHFGLAEGEPPRFDLALLGMGADGHTASLFPAGSALGERERLAVAPWVEPLAVFRVTLTPPVFNNAACVVFLVTGSEKAETVRQVLEDPGPPRYPAQLIQPLEGELFWYLDRAAARLLRGA